jgi:O-antigen/teichoic acid export membrane protein
MTPIKVHLNSFLAFTERFTKTDIKYLLSGGAWLTLGQGVIAGIALLSSLAFAHFVPKDAYGTYRFLLSLFWTLTAFGLTGIPTALARAIAQAKDGAYWISLKLSLVGSLPILVLSLFFAGYYFMQGNMVLFGGALVIGFVGPGMQAAYLYGAVLEGKKAFRINAFSGIILNLIPFLGLFVAMQTTSQPVIFLLINLGLSVITASVISFFTIRKLLGPRIAIETREFKSLGIHLSAMNILATISQQADKLLVFHALGAAELAVYSFATALPDQLRTVFGNLETLSMPKFARRSIQEVFASLGMRLTIFSVIVTGIVVLYILAAPFIFHLLFPAYAESIFFTQVYALSLIPIGTVIPISLLQAHAAKKELYIFNTITPIFQIVAVVVGLYTFGLIGIIISRIASRVVSLGLSLFLTKRLAARAV